MAKKSLGKVIKVHSSGISETDKGIKVSKVFNYGEEIEFDSESKEYSIKEGTKSAGTKQALEKKVKELSDELDDLKKENESLKKENLDLVSQIDDLQKENTPIIDGEAGDE